MEKARKGDGVRDALANLVRTSALGITGSMIYEAAMKDDEFVREVQKYSERAEQRIDELTRENERLRREVEILQKKIKRMENA